MVDNFLLASNELTLKRKGKLMSNQVNTTILEVVSTGQEFNIPGDWSPESLVQTYSANIAGLANMDHTSTVTDGVKRVVFRPRTGTKG